MLVSHGPQLARNVIPRPVSVRFEEIVAIDFDGAALGEEEESCGVLDSTVDTMFKLWRPSAQRLSLFKATVSGFWYRSILVVLLP